MHLIIPYAASHAFTGPEVWDGLQLPYLQALLGQLQRQQVWQDPEPTPLHLPHERLQAQALGWPLEATNLPWAAWQRAQEGQASPQTQAWMTPCHWQVGMDQVVMADPAHLHLSDEESQQLLQAMQPFLQEDGLQVRWHSALLWHVQGELLTHLDTASLDRVIGQNVKAWMPDGPAARPLQRLQSEMQMLLYNHPQQRSGCSQANRGQFVLAARCRGSDRSNSRTHTAPGGAHSPAQRCSAWRCADLAPSLATAGRHTPG